MNRKTVKKLLAEVEICNRRLDSYANKAEKLEQPYRARRAAKFSFPLRLNEEDVTHIHDTVSRTWCTNHSITPSWTNFGAEAGPEAKHREKTSRDYGFDDRRCFGVSLFRPMAPIRWLDMEFHVMEPQTTANQSTRYACSTTKLSHNADTLLPGRLLE
jgi:hypothetical protein